MLKTNDIQINKIKLEATEISVALEDTGVNPEQYIFLKDRLDSYKFYINSEYSIKSEIQYNESLQLVSIAINIIIPDRYIPNDPIKANEIIMDPVDTFQIFYDTQNEIHDRKYRNI